MGNQPLRLGTRRSKLARWQADWTAARLASLGTQVKIVEITTTGDIDQSHDVAAIGAVGLFTKEIQRAVLDETVDFAVHSLKDLPTTLVPGLTIAAVPERAEVADALVARGESSLADLPTGAKIGTGSLRRRAQLLRMRPDLELADIRGNVDTRLRKLDDGQYDAVVLAAAGLTRLGLIDRVTQMLSVDQVLPAPGQGALAIECRDGDQTVFDALTPLNDWAARAEVEAERAMLARVEGGCLAAIGAYATSVDEQLHLRAAILSGDGTERLYADASGAPRDAHSVGVTAGDDLLAQGAARLLQHR